MTSVHSPEYRLLLDRLRRARKDAGMTQAKAAEALLKPQSFISKIESGERKIDPIELKQLAKLYAKPLSFFLPTGT